MFIPPRDNCKVTRSARFNPSSNQWTLDPCTFSDGSSAYASAELGEAGPTFNETSYYGQFSTNLTSYYWYGWTENLAASDILARNMFSYKLGYGSENVTSTFYTKEQVALNPQQEVIFNVGVMKFCHVYCYFIQLF